MLLLSLSLLSLLLFVLSRRSLASSWGQVRFRQETNTMISISGPQTSLPNTLWGLVGIWGCRFRSKCSVGTAGRKKSLNVGYKNQTIIFKIYSHFDQISYVTEFWRLLYLGSLVLFCFASIVTSYDNSKNSEMFLKLAKMSFCDSKYSFW